MGFTSFLKSPKKEQHEVPDNTILSSITKFADNTKVNGNYADDDHYHDDHAVDIMDDLERILGIGEDDEDQKLSKGRTSACQLNWDLMEWDETFRDREDQDEDEDEDEDEEEEHDELFGKDVDATSKCFFEEEGYSLLYDNINGFDDRAGNGGVVVKREHVGFWDDDYTRVSLNLNLNYQEVLDAWSDRGSLWAQDCSLSMATNGSCYMGEVPVMEEERTRREASVMRYKEKRQSRLFSKKIRYQVRKLNADKRPRLKGRFVKRVS